MKSKTVEMARGRWLGILAAYGVDDRTLSGRHVPCPICGGKDRFRFDDKQGNGTWFCNQCGSGTGISLVMAIKGWDFRTAAGEVDKLIQNVQVTPARRTKDPLPRLKQIQAGLLPMDSINPVRLYLQGRNLQPTRATRYHPGLKCFDGKTYLGTFPAMVCQVLCPNGTGATWHVTYLTREGTKAPVPAVKKLMPPVLPLAGCAIRLFPLVDHIGIAEGIETALAVTRDTGVPCWAAANATLLEQFSPPPGVKRVTIFGDNDANYTGQRAAYALARRLSDLVDVRVVIPDKTGSDFAEATA
jgi:putative DNA primase/helicase